MKLLLPILIAYCVFSSCNNNSGGNPFARKDTTSPSDEKKAKPGGIFGKRDKAEDNSRTASTSNWTQNDRNKWLNQCEQQVGNAQAQTICSCVVERLEKAYPNVTDVQEATEEEGEELIKECTSNVPQPNALTQSNDQPVNDADQPSPGRQWTKLQRQQYIQGCETSARASQPGFSSEQIHSYCDCMTSKVEQKFSFQQASRLTAADFQSTEWQNAAADCLRKY